jgi:hypothetical protein
MPPSRAHQKCAFTLAKNAGQINLNTCGEEKEDHADRDDSVQHQGHWASVREQQRVAGGLVVAENRRS